MSELASLFERYRIAVLKKDAPAFLDLYHSQFCGFDMWEEWIKTPQSWQSMVRDWFSSLKTERVEVSFAEVRELVTPALATAQAITRYTAVSAEGAYLRHLNNRLTWIVQQEAGAWKIIHEHTSAPIDPQTGKALMQKV